MTFKRPASRRSAFASFLFVAVTRSCWGCWSPPAEQLVGVDTQLMLSSDVSVAKVISAAPTIDGQIEYAFLVEKRLSGADRQYFTFNVTKARARQEDSTFDRHHAQAFWVYGGGRLFNDKDCVIYPSFVVGNSYLLFLGQPVTRRSFEEIETIGGQPDWNDQWLQYVEQKMNH